MQQRSYETRSILVKDGTEISYSIYEGSEPTVVILHGLAGSSREFRLTAEALSGRRVVLVDQRGHGRSTRVPADTSREAFVNDVVQVIGAESRRDEGVGPVDLVGQSMGAHTAMLVAATHPHLIRRLVLLEGDHGGSHPGSSAGIGEFFRSWPVPFPTREHARAALGEGVLAEAWVQDLKEGPDGYYPRFHPEVMLSTARALEISRLKEWQRVEAPTLVVFADRGMFSEEQKASFAASGRQVTRVDLVDASHDAHLDAFDQWVEVLRSHLKSA